MESELQEFDEKCSRQFDKEGHTRLADPAGLLCALGITPLPKGSGLVPLRSVPFPPILAAWRKRWVKAIAKEKKKIKC